MGPFQLYFGSRSEPVAPIATAFKKPKDIYKTCDWEDFHTFHCLNGRETIAIGATGSDLEPKYSLKGPFMRPPKLFLAHLSSQRCENQPKHRSYICL